MESFRRWGFPTQDEIRDNTQRSIEREAARLREIEGKRLNAEEIARTYPDHVRRAHEARVAADDAARASANEAYNNSRLAWNANEARKKREEEEEQTDENRQPRLVRANIEREAAALPNAGRADSDIPKLKTELETLPMLWDTYEKKLHNRIKKGRLSDATESEKSVAKEARYLHKKYIPLVRKPRHIPYSEEEFHAERRYIKDTMGDQYEYEQKLFAEPDGGPIRIDPIYPHEVYMEMEDGTARYFESGYPKNKKPNPYPFTPTRLRSVVASIQPGLAAGGSRKKKRSVRSKKNRSRKQK